MQMAPTPRRNGWNHALVPLLLILVMSSMWLVSFEANGRTTTETQGKGISNSPGSQRALSGSPSTGSNVQVTGVTATPRNVLRDPHACDSCDPPTFFSVPGRDVASQSQLDPSVPRRISVNREISGKTSRDTATAANTAADSASAQTLNFVPRILQPHQGVGVTLIDPVDSGFPYEPNLWKNGVMDIENSTHHNLKVSLHGPGAAGAVIDGQPVVEGQQYDINGAVQIKSPQPMGVHIRSGGPSVSTLPDSNG